MENAEVRGPVGTVQLPGTDGALNEVGVELRGYNEEFDTWGPVTEANYVFDLRDSVDRDEDAPADPDESSLDVDIVHSCDCDAASGAMVVPLLLVLLALGWRALQRD